MTGAAGTVFGVFGALAAFPIRLAAREVERQHGHLRRGVTRRTTHVVFGRSLLATSNDARTAALFEAERKSGRTTLSEGAFLRLLGLSTTPQGPALSRQAMVDQSGLSPQDVDLLSLFDGFEHDGEPYSFRDLILARKYAGLIASGASWGAIARSVHRSGAVASLTAKSLHHEGRDSIYVRLGDSFSELDGQMLLDLGASGETQLEDLFAEAEMADEDGRHEDAAALYQRCLAMDPGDAVAAFNRANSLRIAGRNPEALHDYARAIKLDPEFVEAWFNLAGLMEENGRAASARRHLRKAIALDGDYADAVFNLAKLEFDAGELAEARRLWSRYLQLDGASAWARTATRGIHLVDLQLAQKSAG